MNLPLNIRILLILNIFVTATNSAAQKIDFAKNISAGGTFSLVLSDDGAVFSFGSGYRGKLGHGDEHDKLWPSRILSLPQGIKIIQASAGSQHSLLLDNLGGVYSFGRGFHGQLGHGDKNDLSKPQKIEGPLSNKKIIQVSAGSRHSLLLDNDGRVHAFGSSHDGQLGLGNRNMVSLPEIIKGSLQNKKVIQISAGGEHSLVLTSDNLVYSFGSGFRGRLGHGDTFDRFEPKLLEIPAKIVQISAGGKHSLLLDSEGHVYSFGSGLSGRLGHGDKKDQLRPRKIGGVLEKIKILQIDAGSDHNLILDSEGKIYSFGNGFYGRLGLGDKNSRFSPTKIGGPVGDKQFVQISAGFLHSLAISDQGQFYSFGSGSNGRLGHGEHEKKVFPTLVVKLPPILTHP